MLTPGAMAWPKWHSAELSHRVRIAYHRARHERAHLPSPLQPAGSSATALRLFADLDPLRRLWQLAAHLMSLSAVKAKIQCKCLHLCTFVQKKYRVLTGPSESPPKWSVYVMVSPALMAPTLVTASAMMAELGPVPLGPRQAVEYTALSYMCRTHAIIFHSRPTYG